MPKGNNGIFIYNPNEQPLPLPKSDESYKGLQSWVESNNQLIYHLLISDTDEIRQIAPGVRLKLIQQLKERNKELRLLRFNRITDKLVNKLEYAIDALMATDIDHDAQYIPVYTQLLASLQQAASNIDVPIETQDAIIFDTIEEAARTDLKEQSREKIRNAAQELLSLCTNTSTNSQKTGDQKT